MSRPIRTAVLVVALFGLAAGCGDDGSSSTDQGSSTSSAVTDTSGTSSSSTIDSSSTTDEPAGSTTSTSDGGGEGIDTMPDADTAPKSAPAPDGSTWMSDIRTGRHEGYDRITFEFTDELPGYTVQYVEPPIIEDGSGDTIEVDGNAYLSIRFEPASTYDLEHGAPVYTGPTTVSGDGTSELIEVVRTGDFEAVLNWVAGLHEEVDFRVTTLDSPARVVVDVRNH